MSSIELTHDELVGNPLPTQFIRYRCARALGSEGDDLVTFDKTPEVRGVAIGSLPR